MKQLDEMKTHVTDEFSILDEDSLILVLGGMSHSVAVAASCGSSGSSSECDGTAVCNCKCPPILPVLEV